MGKVESRGMIIRILFWLLYQWLIRYKGGKYKKRNFHIFAGLEPIVRRNAALGKWEIKVSDCSRCGTCCKLIRENHPLGTENGCKHISMSGNEQLCGLGIFRPYGCAIAEIDSIKECTVKWEFLNGNILSCNKWRKIFR
jgi:hypothetical protein